MLIQLARASRDVCCLIAESLEVGRKFHGGNDTPQIRRHRLKPQQNRDAILVDLLLELIDLFVISNGI